MNDRALTILLGIMVVLSVTTAGLAGASESVEAAECTAVTHSDFLSNEDAIKAAQTDSGGTSVEQNTEVTVSQNSAFVRVGAENPNGYCVELTVEISNEVVAPSDIGSVTASGDSQTEAEWEAIHDYDSGSTHTRVTMRLGAGEDAIIAPSKTRVIALDWTGLTSEATSGDASWIGGLFSPETELEQNEYVITPPENGDVVTVDLTAEDGTEVQDWRASYGDSPVEQDVEDPVYYTRDTAADQLTFHFNKNRNVDFVANPSTAQKLQTDIDSYFNGFDSLFNWGAS
ncbi:hypothetical protein [Halorubrum saccharovorum]|nr:hypothetical protein [Halorubrum saccharovorum]